MKTWTKLIVLLAMGASSLTSCLGSGDEHVTQIFDPYSGYPIASKILYADQSIDTIAVNSLDPWKLYPKFSWLTADPTTGNPQSNNKQFTVIGLKFGKNDSGNKVRQNLIELQAHDVITLPVIQAPYLNIAEPRVIITENEEQATLQATKEIKYEFAQEITSDATRLQIYFRNYVDGATVKTDADWITIPDTVFDKGPHKFVFECKTNTEDKERSAVVNVTSNGITTPITFKQHAQGK